MYRIKPVLLALVAICPFLSYAFSNTGDTLGIKTTNDFAINGKGDQAPWSTTSWVPLTQLDEGVSDYDTRFKILYSGKGIYVLFEGKDHKITSTYKNDFDDLYNADVFEVFFHPQPSTPIYFEYEISALQKELVLLIPNLDDKIMGWRPWHYEKDRQVQKNINVVRGKDGMKSWTAELFFPFELLKPLQKTPPAKGMVWNANFCRLDYDSGHMIKWSWSPVKVSFHEFRQFKSIRFE